MIPDETVACASTFKSNNYWSHSFYRLLVYLKYFFGFRVHYYVSTIRVHVLKN